MPAHSLLITPHRRDAAARRKARAHRLPSVGLCGRRPRAGARGRGPAPVPAPMPITPLHAANSLTPTCGGHPAPPLYPLIITSPAGAGLPAVPAAPPPPRRGAVRRGGRDALDRALRGRRRPHQAVDARARARGQRARRRRGRARATCARRALPTRAVPGARRARAQRLGGRVCGALAQRAPAGSPAGARGRRGAAHAAVAALCRVR